MIQWYFLYISLICPMAPAAPAGAKVSAFWASTLCPLDLCRHGSTALPRPAAQAVLTLSSLQLFCRQSKESLGDKRAVS